MKTQVASNNRSSLIVTVIFGALALSCGAFCTAADSSDVPHVSVKYADLNVSNPQGAEALYNRIRTAAYKVCESFNRDIRDIKAQQLLDACVRSAIRDAVGKVGQPALVTVYNAKNRSPLPNSVLAARAH